MHLSLCFRVFCLQEFSMFSEDGLHLGRRRVTSTTFTDVSPWCSPSIAGTESVGVKTPSGTNSKGQWLFGVEDIEGLGRYVTWWD